MVTAPNPTAGVSLRPSDATQGGLIDNANLLITDASFGWWDYNHTIPNSVPAAKIVFRDDSGTEYEQWYACGDAKAFNPSMDGGELIAMAGATGLNENSNFMIFLKNLLQAGFPENRFETRIAFLKGLYGHFRRIASPERPGLNAAPRTDAQGNQRNNTVLICGQIFNLPWEPSKAPAVTANGAVPAGAVSAVAAAPVAAAAPAPVVNGTAPAPVAAATAPSPAPAAAPATDPTAGLQPATVMEAEDWIIRTMAAAPAPIGKQDLSTMAFREFTNHADRNNLVNLIFNDAYLQSLASAGKIGFDGTAVSRIG